MRRVSPGGFPSVPRVPKRRSGTTYLVSIVLDQYPYIRTPLYLSKDKVKGIVLGVRYYPSSPYALGGEGGST